MRSLSRVIRNSIHFLFSNLMGFAMGLVASVVMARTLGPNDLGIFHQAQWFAGTISVCLSLGFMTSITKFTAQFRAESRTRDLAAVLRHIYRIELGIGVLATLGLVVFSTQIADHYFSPRESPLFILAFLAITPGLQTAVLSAAIEGAQIFRYQSVHALTVTPISLLTKILLLLNGFGLVGLFWANLVFALVNLAFYHWAMAKEGLMRVSHEDGKTPSGAVWRGEWRRYTRSMIGIHFVDLLVWSRSENYFLGRFCQASEIAYYNLAQNLLLRFTGILPNLMWKILLPITSDYHGREDDARLRRTYSLALRYAAAISFPVITACYLASYELIVIFYSHAYAEAKTCFQILCLGAVLTSLAQASSASLYATNRHHFILRFGAVLGVANIALNLWCIPKFGAAGAAASYAVTTGLGAMGGFIYTWHAMGFNMPFASLLRSAVCSIGVAAVLLLFLRLPVEPFDVFSDLRAFLQNATGHDAEILLGARTLRVLSGLFFSAMAYGALSLLLAKPNSDDELVLESLKRYLPESVHGAFKRWMVLRMKKAAQPR